MIRKSIIFTDVPLLKAFQYRELFQLVPFFYFEGMPFSKYSRHFPAVLESNTSLNFKNCIIFNSLQQQ